MIIGKKSLVGIILIKNQEKLILEIIWLTEFLEDLKMMYRNKMAEGGKLEMVEKNGKRVPFYAADGKAKMAMGGRVKKMGGGSMMKKREAMKKGSIPPQLKKIVMAKKKKAKMKKKK